MQTGIHSRLAKTAAVPDGRTVSPDAAYLRQYLQSSQAEPTPLPLPYNVSQFIAFHEGSWPSRLAVESVKNEVFRQSLEIKPLFAAKCTRCGTEFDDVPRVRVEEPAPPPLAPLIMPPGMPPLPPPPAQKAPPVRFVEACPECYGDTQELVPLHKPDRRQRKTLTEIVKRIDKGGRSLKSLQMGLEEDVLVTDIAWTVFSKDYTRHPLENRYVTDKDRDNTDGLPGWWESPATSSTSLLPKVIETTRGHPQVLRFVVDDKDRLGGRFYTCVAHRQYLYDLWQPASFGRHWKPQDGYGAGNAIGAKASLIVDAWQRITPEENPRTKAIIEMGCPECRCRLEEVQVVQVDLTAGRKAEVPTHGYIAGEWLSINRFSTQYRYGRPLMLSQWGPLSILRSADRHIHQLLRDGLPPKGILAIPAVNELSVKAWKDKDLDRGVVQRGHISTFLYDPGMGGQVPSFIAISPSLEELQFTELVMFYLQRICAMYGVSPILTNDTSTGGGLNNDGLELYVTQRMVEKAHSNWHDDWMPAFLYAHHISDWTLQFPPPKEEDRVAVLERRAKNLDLLTKVASMLEEGSDITIEDREEFGFSWTGDIDLAKVKPTAGGGEDAFGGGGGSAQVGSTAAMPALQGVKDQAQQSAAPNRLMRGMAAQIGDGPLTGAEAMTLLKAEARP